MSDAAPTPAGEVRLRDRIQTAAGWSTVVTATTADGKTTIGTLSGAVVHAKEHEELDVIPA